MKSPSAIYPDDVLQKIARELTILHALCTPGVADELDPSPSFELYCEVEHLVLYVIEKAIRGSERLHPSSQSRLAHLLIEEWIASRKPFPKPSSGIVARTIVSLVIKTGLNTKLDRDGYGTFRTVYDSFLNSPYRKTGIKDLSDPDALAIFFLIRVRKGYTQEGQRIQWFDGTRTDTEIDVFRAHVSAHVADSFARAVQTIQLLSY